MDDKKMSSVQAIDRAFLVLETVASDGPLSIHDLHTKLGLNKASLSRIAATLHRNGYLNRDPKSGDYALSLRAFEVGVQAVRNLDYLSLIRSSLSDLSISLDVVAQFSIEDQNELLCIESFDQKNTGFSIYTRVGQRSPLYSTSAGKAILSTYANEEIVEKWHKMDIRMLTPNTHTDIKDLLQEITKIRQQNYALDIEENELGLFCIGTVLMNYNRKPIGAISLSAGSMTTEDQQRFSEVLLQHTRRISNMLGYTDF